MSNSGTTYTITATPTDDSLVALGQQLFKVKTILDLYPNPIKRTDLYVTVVSATCNCDLLSWKNPSTLLAQTVDVATGPTSLTIPPAQINASSKLPTPAIRKCFENGANLCTYSSTWVATHVGSSPGPLPDFITQVGTS